MRRYTHKLSNPVSYFLGDRCFAAAGPWVWNSLPAELRQCDSLGQFERHLKTCFFRIWDHGALWLFGKSSAAQK